VASWSAWYQGLGTQLLDPGNPVRGSIPLGDCGTDTLLGGFSLIAADDLDSAIARAHDCPGLLHGGGEEVACVFELWPEHTFGATR
jgi:hypothetical protein